MKKLLFLFTVLSMLACKNQGAEGETETDAMAEPEVVEETTNEEPVAEETFVSATDDDQMGANIRNFLVNDYLKDDLAILTENDRKFQFFKVDLNDDQKDEYLVRFMSSYFCGTGGCTMLLLDHEGNVMTKFTVMEPPVFVERQPKDWAILLVRSGGELKEMKFNKGTYPSNPSVLPKAPYDAPSGHAIVMFDDEFMTSKTYPF